MNDKDDISKPTTPLKIVADGINFCFVEGLVEATLYLMIIYYILDYSYPAERTKFLIFTQKYLFGLQDNTTTPLKVITLNKKIHDLLNDS